MRTKGKPGKQFQLGMVFSLAVLFVGLAVIGEAVLTTAVTEAAAPTTKLTPQYGGILKKSYDQDALNMGEPVSRPFTGGGLKIGGTAIETLIRHDNKGFPTPWLATSWTVSKDLRSITFTLRKGVKFHDGTDFNAEAARWNLERYRVSNNPELKAVASIDVLDDITIRLILSKWDNTVIDTLSSFPGWMISPTAYQKNGSDWCRSHPVGTGPFKFVSWQRDVLSKFTKFDGYWQKGKPYLDGIEWYIIQDPVSRLLSFQRAEVDQISNIESKTVATLQKEGKYYITACELSAYVCCLVGDSAHPNSPFADIRVRQAVEYAVDKKALMDTLTHGIGKVSNQFAPPGSWGANPDVKGYSYDPQKAKQLLAEAGYPNGFKTKLIVANFGYYMDPPAPLQGYLKQVGIDAGIETLSGPAHVERLRNGWQDGLVLHTGTIVYPDAARNLLLNLSPAAPVASSVTFPKDYEEALNKAVEAPDFKTKQKWTWVAQKLLVDKYGLVSFFYTEPRISATYNKVHDTGVGDTGDHLWTPEDAWIEK